MLNDSASPHSDLEKLWAWRNLPETVEVLKYLRDKSEEAVKGSLRSPLLFKVDGEQAAMDVIRTLQDRFAGNAEGCRELERLLAQRQVELEQKISELKQQEEERHGN